MKGNQGFIVKTVVQSLVWVVVAISYVIGIFAVAFPKPVANLFDRLGNTETALVYHVRVYERDPNLNNLATVLQRSIESKNDTKTIKFGNKFFTYSETEIDYFIGDNDKFLLFLYLGFVEATERHG